MRYHEDAVRVRTLTYRQLYEYACKFSGGLEQAGIRCGDRIAVFLPNCLEYPIVTYAALRIGAIPVLLNSGLKADKVFEYVRRADAKMLVTDDSLHSEVLSAKSAKCAYFTVAVGDQMWNTMLRADVPPKWELEPSHPAYILYTSGTTKEAKGAILSHGNIMSNIESVNRHTGMTSDDIALCFLPLFHCFGQNFVMNALFNAEGTLILHRRFVLDEILASLRRHRVTMFFSIPPNYGSLLDLADISAFASVRYYFTAADKMPSDIVRAWQKKYGALIYEGWGLTELSPFASYNHDTEYVFDTVGTPIEGVEIRVVDERSTPVRPGEMGQIIVRGPNVFQGYLGDPEATAHALRDGWFYTGDMGMLDARGYLSVSGRTNDTYKVSGFFVAPWDIEAHIFRRFGNRIKEVCVFDVPDKRRGKISFAHVVAGPNAPTEADILNEVSSGLAGYQRLGGVAFVDSIPKTPTGKIQRGVLRKQYEGA
ncbi:MAG: AMP-binding protein [bacterium]|nr:AMP-binding protein [bacterium]